MKLFADDVLVFISVIVVIDEDRNSVWLRQEAEKYFLVKEHSWLLNPVSIIYINNNFDDVYAVINYQSEEMQEFTSSSAQTHIYLWLMSKCIQSLKTWSLYDDKPLTFYWFRFFLIVPKMEVHKQTKYLF